MPRVQITRKPLLPVININKNGGGTYDFNHFLGTYHFKPHFVSMRPPTDRKGGEFVIHTSSSDVSIAEARTFLSNIEEGNEILFYIGKDDASKTKIMRGVIETIEIEEPVKDYMNIKISGPDWGSDILKHRIINRSWTQAKEANGVDLDSTDMSTLISQIAQDILNDSQSYPIFDTITAAAQGIVVDAANITPPALQIPQFEANMEFIDDKLSELDDYGYCTHYVDADKNFIMKNIFSSVPSGVLLVDDYEDSEAVGWDQTKVGLLEPPMTFKSTVENHRRRIFGLGADLLTLDQKQETVTNSTQLDTNYLAMLFRPIYTTCHSIGIYVGKVGTPPSNLVWWLVEDNGGEPGSVVLRTMSKDKDAIAASGDWTYFPIGEKLNTAKDYWIVIAKVGDATNTFTWYRDAGATHTNAYSADNVTWTVQTSNIGFAFRQYTSSPLIHYMPSANVATQKHFHEETFRRPDISTKESMIKYLIAISSSRFKRKEIISDNIYAPDTLLLPGQDVRVKTVSSGKLVDGFYTLGDIEYIFQAEESSQTGAFKYMIEASLFSVYT